MLKHRVAAVVCAAALSMIFSRTGAAQMAHGPEIRTETQAVYHSRSLLPPPAARTEAKPAVRTAGAVWVPGFWNLEGDPKTAPHGGRRALGVERGVVYLDPGTLGPAGRGA
jgi:hypothetical protein